MQSQFLIKSDGALLNAENLQGLRSHHPWYPVSVQMFIFLGKNISLMFFVVLFCLPVASVGPVLGHLLYGRYCICIISITTYITSTAISPIGTERLLLWQ